MSASVTAVGVVNHRELALSGPRRGQVRSCQNSEVVVRTEVVVAVVVVVVFPR